MNNVKMTESYCVGLQKGDLIIVPGYRNLRIGIFAEYGAKSRTVRFWRIHKYNVDRIKRGVKIKMDYIINNGYQRIAKTSEKYVADDITQIYIEMKYLLQQNNLI